MKRNSFLQRRKKEEKKKKENVCFDAWISSLFLARFDDHRWIIAHADLGIEDRAWRTLANPEDAGCIALNESRRVRVIGKVISTIGAARVLN